jgi:hypothetical protein
VNLGIQAEPKPDGGTFGSTREVIRNNLDHRQTSATRPLESATWKSILEGSLSQLQMQKKALGVCRAYSEGKVLDRSRRKT